MGLAAGCGNPTSELADNNASGGEYCLVAYHDANGNLLDVANGDDNTCALKCYNFESGGDYHLTVEGGQYACDDSCYVIGCNDANNPEYQCSGNWRNPGKCSQTNLSDCFSAGKCKGNRNTACRRL